jgi:hypothetical protein
MTRESGLSLGGYDAQGVLVRCHNASCRNRRGPITARAQALPLESSTSSTLRAGQHYGHWRARMKNRRGRDLIVENQLRRRCDRMLSVSRANADGYMLVLLNLFGRSWRPGER